MKDRARDNAQNKSWLLPGASTGNNYMSLSNSSRVAQVKDNKEHQTDLHAALISFANDQALSYTAAEDVPTYEVY